MPAFKSTAKSPEIHYVTVIKKENLKRLEYINSSDRSRSCYTGKSPYKTVSINTHHMYICSLRELPYLMEVTTYRPNRLAQQ